MKKWVLGLLISFSCVPLLASADYTLMQSLLGQYSILDVNGSLKAGTVTISADDNGVGYVIAPLLMASDPVTGSALITAKATTTLAVSGAIVTQTGTDSSGQAVQIEYRTKDGYLTITASDGTQVDVTTGKSPGTLLDSKTFFASIGGNYLIQSAGNAPPEGENNQAAVDTTSNASAAAFYMPYCLPTNCDLGYHLFPYSGVQVYQRTMGSNDTVYEILQGSGTTLKHYSWRIENGAITLFNYQYVKGSETVCLEHQLSKTP